MASSPSPRRRSDPQSFCQASGLRLVVDPHTHRPSVLIVSYGLISGGGETFPIYLANGLRAKGWPVAFLDYGKVEPEPGVRAMLDSTVPLYYLQDDTHIASLCQELGIQVVHTGHVSTDVAVARGLQAIPEDSRPGHVMTLHGGYETLNLQDLLVTLPRIGSVDHVTYVAEKNLDNFPKRFLNEKSFTRIPNALPAVSTVARTREELGIAKDALVAMIISRAIPGKGWELAQLAIESVRAKSNRDIQLVLLGHGPVYDQMLSDASQVWTHLLGFQGDIRSWISIADLALLPSTFSGESFPLVVIDFLTMGVPVVASAVGEIPYMLSSKLGTAGYTVEVVDGKIAVENLSACIENFLELDVEARKHMGRCARSASKKFDFDAMLVAFEHVYKSVASERLRSGLASM
jgi:O-antigen biosynthesis protein